MATSGSIDYAATRDDIITEALEHLGVLGLGETPSSDELTSTARTLNYFVKSLQTKVKNLHVMTNLYLFTDTTSTTYTIDGTTAHVVSAYVQTATSAAASSGASSITVSDITGISDNDFIGIKLSDGTRQWTGVNGAPAGSTINLDDTLTASVDSGATVITYTTKAAKPFKISEAFERNITNPSDPTDTPIGILARADYDNLSVKESTGRINQAYFDYQRDSIQANVWPVSDDVNSIVVLKAWRTIEDFDAAADDADFPQFWFQALASNLAFRLTTKYGTDKETFLKIQMMAEDDLMEASGEESEEYMRIVPSYDHQGK